MYLATDDLIRIEEVPVWALVPFGIMIVVALVWSVAWVLRAPER